MWKLRLAIKHRLSHSATNVILELLDIGCEDSKDAQTMLGTTRSKSDEHFEHFGLFRVIDSKLRNGMPWVIHTPDLTNSRGWNSTI